MNEREYEYIIVESFHPENMRGKHGPVHIRPIPGQAPFTSDLFVECNKDLSYEYPVGTRFKIKAKITKAKTGATFVYSHYKWPYEPIE